MPATKETILLIEASFNEAPGHFDRNLTQLRQMGVFNDIAALLVGQFPAQHPLTRLEIMQQMLDAATDGYHFPILINTSFSHVDPLLSLPIGGVIQVNACSNEHSITVVKAF